MNTRGLLFLLALVCIAIPLRGAMTVTITAEAVTAHGLTPGGGAVFFSVGHEPHLAYYTIRRVAQFVADDDRDGAVSFTPAKGVSSRSIWFVVDAASGSYIAAAPPGSPQRVAAEERTIPKKDASGEWTRLVHERSWLELLVIRPGGDVWELTAMRGGHADVEKGRGPDYPTPVELFRGVTPGAKELKSLKKDDILIAIDAHRIEYFTVGIQ